MRHSRVHLLWCDDTLPRRFRTGVSLHSHTLHSQEKLTFLPTLFGKIGWLGWAAQQEQRRHNGGRRCRIDYSRLWWTPPLAPRQAWQLEKNQIEETLGLAGLVSLTDHDNIDAPLMLSVLEASRNVPVSVEWSVPFGRTFFHLGVHNLGAARAQSLYHWMASYTETPVEHSLGEILAELNADPGLLIVLNHPLWDEKGIGPLEHKRHVDRFLTQYKQNIHALELNGFRPWRENLRTMALAEAAGIPVVGGGDRHGCEPNSILNLTRAEDFASYAGQVRAGHNDVVLMPQHRESLKLRVTQAICDVLRDDPGHGLGWRNWGDRVFYRCDDGNVRPLRAVWQVNGTPGMVRQFVWLMKCIDGFLNHSPLRSALRSALAEEEVAL